MTWSVYQRMTTAYREPDRAGGKTIMTGLISSISRGMPALLIEVIMLGRTLTRRNQTPSTLSSAMSLNSPPFSSPCFAP